MLDQGSSGLGASQSIPGGQAVWVIAIGSGRVEELADHAFDKVRVGKAGRFQFWKMSRQLPS